ncbi:cell division protein ZapA [Lederbergia citri]|uniref:Cell division protein ZapA n=1 Tax=Lederbergia citri TaxID=2833580 RepID=A0A942TC08_9BACI|nr:cell division protein ZapA [Lederbergia citri]MBS4194920.1 cell division protein ZapA [Lederbergia citri]
MTENEKIRTMVMIYGEQYTISGTETTEHMQQVASLVDTKMREIHSVNPNLNTSSLAVLTAVNTIHEYIKLQEKYDKLVEEFKQLKD